MPVINRYQSKEKYMQKETYIRLRLDQELKDKIRKDSKEYFGEENMSGWICHLCENYKPSPLSEDIKTEKDGTN